MTDFRETLDRLTPADVTLTRQVDRFAKLAALSPRTVWAMLAGRKPSRQTERIIELLDAARQAP